MSNMNELSNTINALIECGNGLIKAAEDLKAYFSSDEKAETPQADVPASKEYTKEEVRAILSEKSVADDRKYKDAVKELVKKYADGGGFSQIDPKDYEALVKEVEAL